MTQAAFDMSFEQRLARVDLTKVMDEVAAEHGMDAETKTRAEDLYRKYLTLIARYPGQQFVPPRIADLVWHEHITNTREYMADCELLFGSYLHHEVKETDTSELYQVGTLAKLEQDFGIRLDITEERYAAAGCGHG